MKSNVTMIAIALIAVVAIAGVALFLMNSGGNDDVPDEDILEKTDLPVFGNANGDTAVDSKDVDLIKKMISDKTSISKYPFADANRDGVLNDKDVEIVQKIIAGDDTQVTFIDQYDLVAGKYRYVTIDYPLKDIVTQNADMLMLTVMIDADDQVAGYVANIANYPNEFYKVLNNGVSQQLGATARYISAADWAAIKDLDIELQSKGSKIGALLVHSNSALGDFKDDIEAAGIPLIYLRCTDPVYSIDAALLLGFLLGPDYSSKARMFVEDCYSTIKEVTQMVSEIPEDQKKRFIALSMKIYVAESESQYTNIGIQAGGIEMSGLEGNSSTKLQDTEAITKYNDKIDNMLNCSTQDCVVVDPKDLWELSDMRYLEKSTHYHDMVWINMSMPVPCRVMYAASVFYPDLVSHDDADDYFQLMVDKYMSYLDKTVSDGDFDVRTDMFTTISYQDYLDSIGGDVPEEKVISNINARNMAQHFLDTMDLTGYSGVPYTVEGDDQEAHVYPTSGKYYVNYKLYNDAKSEFETKKTAYQAKVGTQSSMGGTYLEMDVETTLTDGYGYYVNVDGGKIGSMFYVGYIDECLVEVHLGYVPSFTDEMLQDIVSALWGENGTNSALEAAKRFDLSLLSKMKNAPYAVASDSNDMLAKIESSPGDREYYIEYNNNADAVVDYVNEKQKHIDRVKEGGSYMGGTPMPIEADGFDDGYGFYGNTTKGFSMIQFVGFKDGTYVTVYLRMDDAAFDDDSVKTIIGAVADTIV